MTEYARIASLVRTCCAGSDRRKCTWVSSPLEEKRSRAPSVISMVEHEIVTL